MSDLQTLAAAFDSSSIAGIFAVMLGFVVGFLSALFGVGGGFVVTPLLHSLGLSAAQSVATSTGQIPFTALSGMARYMRLGHVQWRHAAWLLVGSLPCAQLTAHFVGSLARTSFGMTKIWRTLTLADLLVIGVYIWVIGVLGIYNIWRSYVSAKSFRRFRRSTTILLGGAVGATSALLGIGGGFFIVPYLVHGVGLLPVEAVATSLVVVFFTSAATALHYTVLGQVCMSLSLLIAVGGVVGAQVGARLAVAVAPSTLLRSLGIVQIVATVLYVAIKTGAFSIF